MPAVEVSIPAGAQPVMPQPERTPAAVRAAAAWLDAAVLPRLEAEWTAATAQALNEYSIIPLEQFTEKWWLWSAVRRWPVLAARLRECELRAAEAASPAEARAASAEIGEILRVAADAAA